MKESPLKKQYVYVCGAKDCRKAGSRDLRKGLKKALKEEGLNKRVKVLECSCLDACKKAPNLIIEPGHVFCSSVSQKDDIPKIVRRIAEDAG